mmetsp:Transcript_22124/g.68687  ORF Transcript_22124/g.68687 Transcript_22124/m.68687 type:complete len:480 (+) Transcript_22124:452-1891(+)
MHPRCLFATLTNLFFVQKGSPPLATEGDVSFSVTSRPAYGLPIVGDVAQKLAVLRQAREGLAGVPGAADAEAAAQRAAEAAQRPARRERAVVGRRRAAVLEAGAPGAPWARRARRVGVGRVAARGVVVVVRALGIVVLVFLLFLRLVLLLAPRLDRRNDDDEEQHGDHDDEVHHREADHGERRALVVRVVVGVRAVDAHQAELGDLVQRACLLQDVEPRVGVRVGEDEEEELQRFDAAAADDEAQGVRLPGVQDDEQEHHLEDEGDRVHNHPLELVLLVQALEHGLIALQQGLVRLVPGVLGARHGDDVARRGSAARGPLLLLAAAARVDGQVRLERARVEDRLLALVHLHEEEPHEAEAEEKKDEHGADRQREEVVARRVVALRVVAQQRRVAEDRRNRRLDRGLVHGLRGQDHQQADDRRRPLAAQHVDHLHELGVLLLDPREVGARRADAKVARVVGAHVVVDTVALRTRLREVGR